MYADRHDLEKIGDYFHALEDTYAHCTGVGDRNWDYYHDLDLGLADIGHGLHGHDPDFTWNDVPKANKMAKTVFEELKALAKSRGISSGKQWSDIEATVNKFNGWSAKTYTDIVHNRLTKTASFEGYNEKIQILNPSFQLAPMYRSEYKDAAHRGPLRAQLRARSVIIPLAGGLFNFGY